MPKKILLIDGNALTYRAYYGSFYQSKKILTNSNDVPINAVLVLYKMINKIIQKYKPSNIFVAFDAGKKTIRHNKFKKYKSGRKKTPPELISQFPIVKEMFLKMGINYFELENIEADDIIATMAKKFNLNNNEIMILSSDKDLYQLVNENTCVIVPQNGEKEEKIITQKNFFEIMGYYPNQVKEIKALVGDSSDNLPGVQGIGPKTAINLLNQYNNIENIYNNIDSIKGALKDKLIKDKEMAFLCKDLATLFFDLNIPFSLEETKFEFNINEELLDFFKKYQLYSLLKKYSFKKEEKIKKEDKKKESQISFKI